MSTTTPEAARRQLIKDSLPDIFEDDEEGDEENE